MKKASVVNLIIIIGLLVLSVMTLTIIYATAPEPQTVLVFEENFDVVDDTKWKERVAECRKDGDRFHYSGTNGENGYVEDGVLHLRSTPSNESDFRANCSSCIQGEIECVNSSYSAGLRSKNLFEARYGRIEVRAKLPAGGWIKSSIGIVPNDTESENIYEGFNLIETIRGRGGNGSAGVRLSFGSPPNRTVIESEVTRKQFHVYEIEWGDDGIVFKIDNRDIEDQINRFADGVERKNETGGIDASFNQPFYLDVGVDREGKAFPNGRKRSADDPEEDALQVDYIKLFKISP